MPLPGAQGRRPTPLVPVIDLGIAFGLSLLFLMAPVGHFFMAAFLVAPVSVFLYCTVRRWRVDARPASSPWALMVALLAGVLGPLALYAATLAIDRIAPLETLAMVLYLATIAIAAWGAFLYVRLAGGKRGSWGPPAGALAAGMLYTFPFVVLALSFGRESGRTGAEVAGGVFLVLVLAATISALLAARIASHMSRRLAAQVIHTHALGLAFAAAGVAGFILYRFGKVAEDAAVANQTTTSALVATLLALLVATLLARWARRH